MIVTVTPNPSLDRTLEVTTLVRGEVLRAFHPRVEAGGKGINVARALHANGRSVRPVLPCGGFEGNQLVALLAGSGLVPVVITIHESIRANISVVEPDGTTTKINEPGPRLDAFELEQLLAASEHEAAEASWVVGSGSLPPGTPAAFYRELTQRSRAAGARVAIDTSGTALSEALLAMPDLIKPNRHELAAVSGLQIRTIGDAVTAAQRLRNGGPGTILASLGADGALLVDAEGVLYGWAPVESPRSTVGAGDASLAGYLAADGTNRSAALRSAVAFGAAAVALPGSQMPAPDDVRFDRVEVTDDVPLARALATSDVPAAAPA